MSNYPSSTITKKVTKKVKQEGHLFSKTITTEESTEVFFTNFIQDENSFCNTLWILGFSPVYCNDEVFGELTSNGLLDDVESLDDDIVVMMIPDATKFSTIFMSTVKRIKDSKEEIEYGENLLAGKFKYKVVPDFQSKAEVVNKLLSFHKPAPIRFKHEGLLQRRSIYTRKSSSMRDFENDKFDYIWFTFYHIMTYYFAPSNPEHYFGNDFSMADVKLYEDLMINSKRRVPCVYSILQSSWIDQEMFDNMLNVLYDYDSEFKQEMLKLLDSKQKEREKQQRLRQQWEEAEVERKKRREYENSPEGKKAEEDVHRTMLSYLN